MTDHSALSERDKLLAKIQKCMRLAKSSNAHEAAAAMRQAQKMMEQHGIDEGELLGLEVTSLQFITIEPYKRSGKTPMYMAHLIATIMRAFDVEAVEEVAWVCGKPRMAVRYFGMKGKPDMAVYAHAVMWRQLMAAWKEYSKTNPWVNNERGARQGFWIGWLREVRSKVMEFAGSAEEKEMRTKAIDRHYGGNLGEGKTNSMSVSGTTAQAGRAAAGDFSIHRPMNGEQQRRLK